MSLKEDDICLKLKSVLIDDVVDEDIIVYLSAMIAESEEFTITDLLGPTVDDSSPIYEAIGPFLESSGCESQQIMDACIAIHDLAKDIAGSPSTVSTGEPQAARKLKQGVVSMSSDLSAQTDAEIDANRHMWGRDQGVAVYINKSKDAYKDNVSAKDKRKQRQELERERRQYQAKLDVMQEEDGKDSVVSSMVLPDYGTGKNERDIQVKNVSLSLDNGRCLLDGSEIKFSHKRRYGLVGKNGIGKTTLLKAIASLEIEGFPKHHRVLHVRQEVRDPKSDKSVMQAVMDSDVERLSLLAEQNELTKRLESDSFASIDSETINSKREELMLKLQNESNDEKFNTDLKRLDEVYARLNTLSADSATSRACNILSGLQFTPEMQAGPITALSGGWRMRVSLAAALFIEPDLLLLDEPTNHLDLEAVLWLESYLVEYKHTVVVVSHNRGFLNQICTDIIEFKNKKLIYYKGNYDIYVRTSTEKTRNQMRAYQAYQDKRAHLVDFIEKFRANAKRASLVQSRIKAVEKMDEIKPEEVEIESEWRFAIPNPEPLGQAFIISIDDASFDYNSESKDKSEYLLRDVNFGVDLQTRIGILGRFIIK